MRRALAILLLLLLPVRAFADARDDARRYFKAGMEAIAAGQHRDGAEKLQRAYDILPHPNVLYNIGLAWADAGAFDEAITAFQRYLDSGPADAEAVLRLVALLRQQQDEAKAPAPPAPEPAPVEATPSSPQVDALLLRLEALASRIERGEPAPAPTADVPEAELLEARAGDFYDAVVVSASRQATSPSNAPSAITVISAEQIRLSGAQTVPDLLRRVPGLSILTMGAGSANLAIRGFNQRISNKVLVLVDGRSVYFDFLGGTFYETLDIDLRDIERIEVIRGPGSVLYGANAFGGVVNIITKAPGERNGGSVTVGGGSGETLLGNVNWSGRAGIAGFRGSVGYRQTDRYALEYGERNDFEVTTDDVTLAVRGVRANGALRIVPGPKTSVGLSAGLAYTYDNFFAIGLFRDFWMRSLVTNVRADLRLSGLTVRAFWNGFDAQAAPTWQPIGGLDLSTHPKAHVIDVEAGYAGTFTLGVRHDYALGAGYRLKTIDWSYLDARHTEQHVDGFVEDRITFVPQLVAVVGFRFDQHPLVGFTPSPRGSLLVKPSERSAIRVSIGTAFRTPTFLESYLDLVVPSTVTGVGVQSKGNVALRPENILSVELGGVFEGSDYVNFSIDGWYERVSGLIALSDVVPNAPGGGIDSGRFVAGTSSFENAGGVFHGWGAEGSVHAFPLDGLDLRADYAFSYFLDEAKKQAGLDDFRDKRHPQHTLTVGASYRSRFGLDANVDLHVVSAVVVPERTFDAAGNVIVEDCAAETYAMLNARLGWRFAKDLVEIGVTGSNLTAFATGGHREHCLGTPVGARVVGTGTLRF